ncbi:hypothetical protein PanWU01x14_174550 [Parasponia andersonii]|uniref:Uncharacterized protein n=1 Tax=Parasponia andersonii TaxID=3476 RepID=A0A2P5C8G1_PARAD|nr:hypothetical protein PanWU01x14_174550 [Parasponia andersonii]
MHQNFSAVSKKGTSKHGSFHRRPASFDSSKRAQSQHSNKGSLSPILNESFQCDSTSKFEKSKIFSASVPRPKMLSRAKAHSSRRSSPAYLESITLAITNLDDPEIIIDVSNEKEENLSLEINRLRAKVEDLTCKSENLEAELKKTSRRMTEATITAGMEAEKTKAAKGNQISCCQGEDL